MKVNIHGWHEISCIKCTMWSQYKRATCNGSPDRHLLRQKHSRPRLLWPKSLAMNVNTPGQTFRLWFSHHFSKRKENGICLVHEEENLKRPPKRFGLSINNHYPKSNGSVENLKCSLAQELQQHFTLNFTNLAFFFFYHVSYFSVFQKPKTLKNFNKIPPGFVPTERGKVGFLFPVPQCRATHWGSHILKPRVTVPHRCLSRSPGRDLEHGGFTRWKHESYPSSHKMGPSNSSYLSNIAIFIHFPFPWLWEKE